MNTIKSVYYGWATLIVAGGGAYYFAKKSINADRAAKAEAERLKRQRNAELEASLRYQNPHFSSSSMTAEAHSSFKRARENKDWQNQVDGAGEPSSEASHDPAPTRHAPENEAQKVGEKSKYEATDVYRSRKGDRFS